VVFTSDLEGYFIPEASGGFALRSTKDQKVIASFPDASRKPARWFVLSPDDREVSAVMNDYGVEVWPVGAPEPRLKLHGTYRHPAVAEFHPRGESVAGYVTGEGAFLQRGDERRALESTNRWAIFMRFDPAGERLAVVRDPGGLELWRCTPEPALLWFQPILRTVPWLAWSPDGRKLAAAADDGRGIRIFSADDGQTELVYSQHLLYPRQFEFDPSGRMIASMGQDWALRLWDARTGQDLVTGVGRHRVMRFSRDGRRLSTTPTDRELAILELAPEEVFREFRTTPSSEAVTPSRLIRSGDGRLLATAHPQIRLYDIARAEEIGLLPPSFATTRQVFFENSEDSPASDSDANRGALLYSIFGKGIYQRTFSLTNGPNEVGRSCEWGEEKLVAKHTNAIIWNAVEFGRTWIRHGSNGVEIWPGRDHSQARRLAIRAPLERLATSQDGRWAAAPDYANQKVTICDCRTGQIKTNLPARGID
jgi:WD40 repeat protein